MGMSKPLCSAEREEQVWIIYYFALEIQLFCSLRDSSRVSTSYDPCPRAEWGTEGIFYLLFFPRPV